MNRRQKAINKLAKDFINSTDNCQYLYTEKYHEGIYLGCKEHGNLRAVNKQFKSKLKDCSTEELENGYLLPF